MSELEWILLWCAGALIITVILQVYDRIND